MEQVNLIIYASGFYYETVGDELTALSGNNPWVANWKDFEEISKNSGYIYKGARNVNEFISSLQGALVAPESRLKHLGILAHGDGTQISLSGPRPLDPNKGLEWPENRNQQITVDTLIDMNKEISSLKGKFLFDAQITLYTCNSGREVFSLAKETKGKTLIQTIADTFGIPTGGYKKALHVCADAEYNRKGLAIRIVSRGWITDKKPLVGNCKNKGYIRDILKLKPHVVPPSQAQKQIKKQPMR